MKKKKMLKKLLKIEIAKKRLKLRKDLAEAKLPFHIWNEIMKDFDKRHKL